MNGQNMPITAQNEEDREKIHLGLKTLHAPGRMGEINSVLRNWAVEKIQREYPEDICLLIENSFLRLPEDAAEPAFDYFVPATERGYELGRTFIVEGIGRDLYPRSWERLEKMADLEDDNNTTCLGEGILLYARSREDEERFRALQERLRRNLQDDAFCRQKALKRLAMAMEIFQTLVFQTSLAQVRKGAGYIMEFLAVGIAFANHTYLKATQTYMIEELEKMDALPENFTSLCRSVLAAENTEEIKHLSYEMLVAARTFFEKGAPAAQNKAPNDFSGLAGWYHELSYTWLRIYRACEESDFRRAYAWGMYLQNELDVVAEEFCLPPMDLLGVYSPYSLTEYRSRAEELELQIRGILRSHGASLDEWDTVEEFLKAEATGGKQA